MEIRDLVLHPPETNPYTVLKETLIKRTAASEQQRLQQLFQAEELGDRKPTQLLRRMQQLVGDRAGIDESFIRELFLQRLPSNVRMVLAASPSTIPLQNLAELADRVRGSSSHSAYRRRQHQQQLATSSCRHSADFDRLVEEMAKLQATVKSLVKQRGRSHSRHRSPTPTPATDQLCWYHQKFGDEARKCVKPCSHPN